MNKLDVFLATQGIPPSAFQQALYIWLQTPPDERCEPIAPDPIQRADPVPYIKIQQAYNRICTSYPKLTAMSEARKKAIKARYNAGYQYSDFEKLFETAQASDFLKGKNTRNWSANFDWMIRDANMAKVLDGNYSDAGKSEASSNASYDLAELENLINHQNYR